MALLIFWQGFFSVAMAQEGSVPLFVDVSEVAGIVNNRVGTDKTIGQAWGDYDGDGWLDLYVTDSNGRNTLYHNNQDGTFAVSPYADIVALADAASGGATFVDYDNDGWADLYVLNWGANALFHNEAGTGFVEVTAVAQVGGDENSKTASWGDYDQDGFVDLYVANWSCYPRCGRPSTGEKDAFYHNNGDGTFTNVSHLLGGGASGAGFVASFTDYDNDGDPDIYLVNDEFIYPIGNKLWRNDGLGADGEWQFTELSKNAGADTRIMGMGLATSDYDNDGDIDFYFSNAGPMTLLQNQGDGTFTNMAEPAGVNTPDSIGWGAIFFDYDNDGWRDLYLAVAEARRDSTSANPLFHNNGDGTFTNVAVGSGVGDTGTTIGVAKGDYDRDGRVDLVIGNHDGGYKLYHNQGVAGADNQWLTLELRGGGSVNRDAIGARVYLTTQDGVTQLQEVQCGSSLGAGNEMALHFGLGDDDAAAEITVLWPDGVTQTFEDVAANQRIELGYPVDANAEITQQFDLFGENRLSVFRMLYLWIQRW